ncbi:MAG: TetR/AcrR family transcriptional regulator [Solirubrobacteraceae bacterium]|nr:TetR/AcrR family transcriptional regulator [Patulibacter sp.]
MGHSRDDKAKSHERIVEIAAVRMREAGTAGPGVAEIMKEAGLTHGGFYKHFSSRDQLVAEAVDAAFLDGQRALIDSTDGADDQLAAFVDTYASAAHRDGPGSGCGIAALAADAARGSDALRDAYGQRLEAFIGRIEAMLGDGDPEVRRRAVVSLSTLVGGLALARAVGAEHALSDEILEDVRDAVKAQAFAG